MKKLFNFRLLVLIGVLIMSVPQVWAGKKTIYFDVQNISWWKNDDVVKVHAWGGAATEDVSMTVYSGNMLTCQINDDQTKVCFYRYYNSKWNEQTIDKTDAATKNCWTLLTSTSDSKQNISNGYEYEPTAGLLGGMNSWNAGTLSFDGDGNVEVALPAGQTYQFKILDGTTWYSYNSYGFSTSATDFTLYTSNSECSITTSTAGTYHFHWDRTNHTLCIFFPNDYAKARLTKSKYIYFDARKSDSDHWNQAAFASRFYFKYYDSGQDQSNTFVLASAALETSVYPVTVPNNDYIGRVQINRWSADGKEDWTNATSVIHAYTRSSSAENCIVIPDGQASSWTPSVEWTTYCPPMSSATLSNNSTSVISWTSGNGTSGNPYLVPADGTVKVSASATSAFPSDDNMTIKYDFKVSDNGGEASSNVKTTNTYDKGSLTNNHTYTITLDAYNTYNGAEGTKLTASQTLYYKALDTYSVTNTLTNISSDGRSSSDAAAYNIAYTATLSVGTGYNLPASITVKRGETTLTSGTHYSYNSSTGALTINAAQVTGNLTIIASGVAKTYSEENNLDKNTGDNHGTYTATFDATTIAIDPAPTKTNYHVDGYYLEAELSNRIADASGNLAAGITKSAVTYTDGDGKWKKDANVKLYTKWEDDIHDVTVNAQTGGTVSYNGGAAGSSCTARAGIATASADIVATASAGYYFVGWSLPDGTITKATESAYNGSTSTYTINATADGKTVTALFNVRYALLGSQNADGEPTGGMPGWGEANESPFAYSDGTYTKSVSLTVPNANYKFRIVDRRGSAHKSYGLESKAVISADNNFHDLYYDTDETTKDALLATAGRGYYTITVQTNGSGAPQVKITNPTSYLVHFGKKCFTIDGDDEGDLGGTITVSDASGNTYADGKYIASGETVTISASAPTGYHFAEWHANSSYNYEFGDKKNPHSWTVSEAVNAYAKFVEDVITPTGSGNWSAKVGSSSLTDVVTINSTITVDVDHALAKRVILDQSADGKAGKLVITANKGLEVAEGIWINNGSALVAPTAEDLVLESSASGNATLIFDNDNFAAATVQMYSKASVVGSTWNWQYMATAFSDANALYDYYGCNLYKWDGGWQAVPSGATLDEFAGYCITNKSGVTTYNTDGTLTTKTTHEVTLGTNQDMVIGNSWTAPIYIGGFTEETFTSEPATIYLFNTGSASGGADEAGGDKYAAGTYITIPVHSGEYTGDELIAPLQAFFVTTVSGSAGKITMNYDELVRTTTNDHRIDAGPMRAPKRVKVENDPDVMKIWANGAEYNDRVVILEREDFSNGFDNGWDGTKKSFSDAAPSVYVITSEGSKDAVSAIPDFEGTVLGFLAGEDSECTMSFEYDGENDWYLNDLKEENSTLIAKDNTYTFACSGDDTEARFVISATPIKKITTGTDNIVNGTNARKQMINGTLYIVRDGRLYNAEGAVVK